MLKKENIEQSVCLIIYTTENCWIEKNRILTNKMIKQFCYSENIL